MTRFTPLFILGAVACTAGEAPTGGLVDETGYLDAERVYYTARQTLEQPQSVTVFGLPGALLPADGILTSADGASVFGPSADGAFQVGVMATVGETLTFQYVPPGLPEQVFEVVLSDDLQDADAPQSTSIPFLSPTASDGIEVVMQNLSGGPVDRVAFNATNFAPSVLSIAGATVVVQGQTGDEICVFSVDGGAQSPSTCAIAP